MFSGLAKWFLGIFVEKLLGFFRNIIKDRKAAQDARDAGAAEANLANEYRAKERAREAMEAEIEADRRFKTMPGDETSDDGFRRD